MKTFNTYYENAEQIKNYVYENSLNDYRRGASSIPGFTAANGSLSRASRDCR